MQLGNINISYVLTHVDMLTWWLVIFEAMRFLFSVRLSLHWSTQAEPILFRNDENISFSLSQSFRLYTIHYYFHIGRYQLLYIDVTFDVGIYNCCFIFYFSLSLHFISFSQLRHFLSDCDHSYDWLFQCMKIYLLRVYFVVKYWRDKLLSHYLFALSRAFTFHLYQRNICFIYREE